MAVEGPRNLLEQARVEIALRSKYPQMYEEGWGKPKPKPKAKPKAKAKSTMRTKAVQRDMGDSAGGIMTDEEKLMRLIGR